MEEAVDLSEDLEEGFQRRRPNGIISMFLFSFGWVPEMLVR